MAVWLSVVVGLSTVVLAVGFYRAMKWLGLIHITDDWPKGPR